jgi:hypothetical protein
MKDLKKLFKNRNMKHIKLYEGFEDLGIFDEEWDEKEPNFEIFNKEKLLMINEVNDLMIKYDEFTKKVSSEDWRLTGTHYTNLRIMKEDINTFKPITQRDIDWLKKNEL